MSQPTMHSPSTTPSATIAAAPPEAYVVLARGCNKQQLTQYAQRPVDSNTSAPADAEARAQVAEAVGTGLYEFSSKIGIATSFARGNYLMHVAIQRKFLTQGSVTEGGWVCRQDAPFAVLSLQRGAPLIGVPAGQAMTDSELKNLAAAITTKSGLPLPEEEPPRTSPLSQQAQSTLRSMQHPGPNQHKAPPRNRRLEQLRQEGDNQLKF